MDVETGAWEVREGYNVVGSDGEKVGEVIGLNDAFIVVEKGFFFPTDYYIPTSAIAGVEGDKVRLSVTRDDALEQGWDVVPGDESVGTPGGAFLTGATSYDEQVGVDADGDPVTDADLRADPEYTLDESEEGDRPKEVV